MIRGHDLQNVTCKPNTITTLCVSAVIGRFIKNHHVMMTFLVFDLDVLFIPCY